MFFFISNVFRIYITLLINFWYLHYLSNFNIIIIIIHIFMHKFKIIYIM